MTVGISVQTNDISILCADSRLTVGGVRHYDVSKKLVAVDSENYALAICAAGNANTAQKGFDSLKEIEADSLEECIETLHQEIKSGWDEVCKKELEKHQRMRDEQMAINNVDPQSRFAAHIIQQVQSSYHNSQRNYWASFFVHAIDKTTGKKHVGLLTPEGYSEGALPSACMGTGQEGANQYVIKALPSKDVDLSEEELLYHVLAAYAHSTGYAGVGGIPLFAVTSKGNVKVYDDAAGCLSTNLVSACLAGILPKEKVITGLGLILSEKAIGSFIKKLLEEHGEVLGISAEGLSTLPIPYSAWDYRAKALD